MATQYMLLVLPTPGTTNDFTGEQQLITALTSIDAHTHISGSGLPIRVAALSIDADVSFNMAGLGGPFNATGVRALRFSSLGAVPTALTDIAELLCSGGDLYWRNGSGQTVPITSGAALSATSIGGISGLAAPAAATYSGATFSFRSNANVAGTLDIGPLVIRDTGVSALGISIVSPVGLASGYSLTLPTALPASLTLPLTVSPAGVLSTSPTLQAVGTASRGAIAIFGQSTPSTTNDGDIWYDTSTSRPRFGFRVDGVSSTTITAPTLNANWTATNGLGYWKSPDGVVHFRGSASAAGGATNPAFTLPAAFRPLNTRGFASTLNGTGLNVGIQITIQSSGAVSLFKMTDGSTVPTGADLYMDGVFFLAEQ